MQITPQVAGTVVSVNADDTDFVKAGQTLVTLDRADAEVALAQAQAALAQTVREVRSLVHGEFDVVGQHRAARGGHRARAVGCGPHRGRPRAAQVADQHRRRQRRGAEPRGGRSQQRAAALSAAQAALTAAKQQLATNQSLTEGTTVEKHPNVERAAAKVREAYLAYARAILPAPVTGYVAKRTVQVGQRVAPGAPLMSIIPLDQVWVDANFKEVQLRKMRIGQPVTLTADAYGSARRISRHAGRTGRRNRQRLRVAAGAKCDRQLDQGRAARPGAHRARPQGTRRPSAARRPVDGSGGRRRQHGRQDARRRDRGPPRPTPPPRSITTRRTPTRWCARPSPPTWASRRNRATRRTRRSPNRRIRRRPAAAARGHGPKISAKAATAPPL